MKLVTAARGPKSCADIAVIAATAPLSVHGQGGPSRAALFHTLPGGVTAGQLSAKVTPWVACRNRRRVWYDRRLTARHGQGPGAPVALDSV
jgi:hypothetical protein